MNNISRLLSILLFCLFAELSFATSFIPGTVKTVTANETLSYSTLAAADATTAGNWIVNPRGVGTGSCKYTNTNNDNNGNPNSIVDNIATISSSVAMPKVQVQTNTKYNQSGKYLLHMRLTGITGIIVHGVTTSSNRGIQIHAQEYSSSMNENTQFGPVVASQSRNGNSGSFILQHTGFDASKEYLITVAGVGGDVQVYAIELIAGSGGGGSTTVAVTGVSLNKTATTLTVGNTETLTATVAPANATNTAVTWSTSNASVATVNNGVVTAVTAGTATITVTTTDGSKTATCTVTVNPAPSNPIAVTGVALNKTTTSIAAGANEQLTATISPSNATNTAVTWTSSNTAVATVDNTGKVTGVAAGTATITVTTTDGSKTATCTVTVTAAPASVAVTGVTLNSTTLSLSVGGTSTLTATVAPTTATNKNVTWSSSNTSVATVDNTGKVTGVAAGTATITVTTADGNKTATCAVTVAASTPVTPPSTTLTIHETEVYEAPQRAGGYGTPLVQYGGREYEVYYFSKYKPASSDMIGVATYSDLTNGKAVSSSTGSSTSFSAADGWFSGTANGIEGSTFSSSAFSGSEKAPAANEFVACPGDIKIYNNNSFSLHIKGFEEFALYAKDNTADMAKGKYLKVYIDGVDQQMAANNSAPTIRRFSISAGEHVIKVEGIGGSNNYVYGFSLKLGYVPKVKYQEGDTTNQLVGQTRALAPVKYFLKNKISAAELSWNGPAVPGIALQPAVGDTFLLQGNANAQVGTYHYVISAKDANGVVVSTSTGKFSIRTAIRAKNGNDMTVYQNNAMPTMTWDYDALSTDSIVCTWTSGTPAGLTFTKDQTSRTVTLTGTPTTPGIYPYTIVCKSGNTLSGTITVKSNSPTIVPGATKTLLYLYKDKENSGIFSHLSSKYNYFARPASDALSAVAQYNAYDAIVISEDVDATSGEVLAIIQTLKKPVLNMKIFTYSSSRLGWGDPNNGSISNKQIKVKYSNHPIFRGLSGSTLTLLTGVENNKGLMPADVTLQGSICLATAPKRGDDYDSDGEEATFIHEVPADVRGAKYLTYPIALGSTANLTREAKTLFDNMIDYLTSNTASGITLPELKIVSFSINGVDAAIDQTAHTISVTLPIGTDASALSPVVTLASAATTVTPGSGETVDFSDTHYGVVYTVSDGINIVKYTVKVYVPTALYDTEAEGIWYGGEILHNPNSVWVNIFNVSGQLVTTTNSDFSFDGMPRGMYIVRSQQSMIKVMH